MKSAASKKGTARVSSITREVPWDQRPHVQMAIASQVAGVSPSTLYSLAAAGKLKLVKLAGRTLADTASLKAFIARREDWTPSARGAAARAKRTEVARAGLRL